MKQMKKYLLISLAMIITITLAIVIAVNKEKKETEIDVTKSNSQKIYKGAFENPNNGISEVEKNARVEAAKNAIKEFESLPLDTPYSVYDQVYEDIATNYISKLPNIEYEKYFNILDKLEQRFFNNPNRQY
ncbi:MAG: hypothetical protein AB6733_03395 [Clostridiaceae bacterium]